MLLLALLTGSWIQIESPRFLVRTDLPEMKARALLDKLEHDVVDASDVPQLALMQVPERQRQVLVVFAKPVDFDAVFKWEATSGPRFTTRQMLSGEDKTRIYFTADAVADHVPSIARRLMRDTVGDLMETPPLWLTMGLEAYAASAKREDGNWLLGSPPDLAISGEVPSLDQLLLVNDEYSLGSDLEKKRIEVCSWHLMHLLLQGTADYPVSKESMQRLATWFAAIRAEKEPADALLRAFAPLDLAGLYAAHFKAAKLTVSRSPAKVRATSAKAPLALPNAVAQPPGDTAQAVLLNTPALKAEGHVHVAMASSNVATRRAELKSALESAPNDWSLLAMSLRNELAYEGAEEVTCREAKPVATKLLSSPMPRHKNLARQTLVGCARNPVEPPAITVLKPPMKLSGNSQPRIAADVLQRVKGNVGGIVAKIRVNKEGDVTGVFVVRSTIPDLDASVVELLRTWKFVPANTRFEFLQPFKFNFAHSSQKTP